MCGRAAHRTLERCYEGAFEVTEDWERSLFSDMNLTWDCNNQISGYAPKALEKLASLKGMKLKDAKMSIMVYNKNRSIRWLIKYYD